MKGTLDVPTLALFALFVLPGLISMAIYRLRMPARQVEWAESLVQGLFYSSINYVLLLPLILFISQPGYSVAHPWTYWALVLFSVVVAPVVWPSLLVMAFRWRRVSRLLKVPFPTVWDSLFDQQKEPLFMLIHLTDGRRIGGYWGPGSYAGSYPHDGDLYVSAVYEMDDSGRLTRPVADTAGLHIRKEQYSFVEFLRVPERQPAMNFSE
jgi:hypothetical protein